MSEDTETHARPFVDPESGEPMLRDADGSWKKRPYFIGEEIQRSVYEMNGLKIAVLRVDVMENQCSTLKRAYNLKSVEYKNASLGWAGGIKSLGGFQDPATASEASTISVADIVKNVNLDFVGDHVRNSTFADNRTRGKQSRKLDPALMADKEAGQVLLEENKLLRRKLAAAKRLAKRWKNETKVGFAPTYQDYVRKKAKEILDSYAGTMSKDDLAAELELLGNTPQTRTAPTW